MPQARPTRPKGRGSSLNPTGRFEARSLEAFDDGWGSLESASAEKARPRTTLIPESTRNILSENDSPDVPFSLSINPYKGCEHGCSYCFARPTHAYLGLSPGLDFETKIFTKPQAPQRLRECFAQPHYVAEVIAIGANTDPYQPAERELKITRQLLEVMLEHQHPCAIVTKSQGILRDLDLLAELARLGLVQVMVSITTLDAELARRMEPRASAPAARLKTVKALRKVGVPVGVLASPIIPALNDAELEKILTECANRGATQAGYILLRLAGELAGIFSHWLEEHYPERREHVLSLLRQAHGGRLYQGGFGRRMSGQGPWAKLLARRFDLSCARLGLNRSRQELRTDLFRRTGRQLDLF
jgi:DNA repair photolyase